ncbi:MAG: DUF4468 domain-containing protein [Bacteroidia bacterium]|nr:DUF4468 domain-containing protein [Bacteroidia bacterium]
MKNGVVFSFFLLAAFGSFAQEKLVESKIIQADSLSKDDIFIFVNEWFAKSYKSANDVIQMSDKEAGIVVGKGRFTYSYGKIVYAPYEGYVSYTIKVAIKDSRFKVELTDFTHAVNPGNAPNCALGLISTAAEYTTTGMSKMYHNNVWVDLKGKSQAYAEQVFLSIEKDLQNYKAADKDDW